MDSRVILNLPRAQDLASIPELDGAIEAKPILTRSSSVNFRGQVSLIIPTFFNVGLKRGSLCHLLSGVGDCVAISEIVLASSDGEQNTFSELAPITKTLPIKIVE